MVDTPNNKSLDTIFADVEALLKTIINSDEAEANKLISNTTALLAKIVIARKRIAKVKITEKK